MQLDGPGVDRLQRTDSQSCHGVSVAIVGSAGPERDRVQSVILLGTGQCASAMERSLIGVPTAAY